MFKLWKNQLPVPTNEHDCYDLIDQTEYLLDLLSEDSSYVDSHDFEVEAFELLDALSPEHVAKDLFGDEWKRDVLIWLFTSEAMGIIRNHNVDSDYRDTFRTLCKDYIEYLRKEQDKFQGNE